MTETKTATIVCLPSYSDEEEELKNSCYTYADWHQLVEDYVQPYDLDNCPDNEHTQLVNYVNHIHSYWSNTGEKLSELQNDGILDELSLSDEYADYIDDFLSSGDYEKRLSALLLNIVAHIHDNMTLCSKHIAELNKIMDTFGDDSEEEEEEDDSEEENDSEEEEDT